MPDRNKAFEFLNEVEVKENKEKKVIKKGTVFKLSFKLNAYDIHFLTFLEKMKYYYNQRQNIKFLNQKNLMK